MEYEVVTNGGNLNVRAGPGTRHRVTEKLRPGDKVKVMESRQDGDDRWMKLATGGWVSADFLNPVAVMHEVATRGSNLNVRWGPGTNYAAKSKLRQGEKVKVIGSARGWLQLDGGGWASADYLKPVTEASAPTQAPTSGSGSRIDQSQLAGKIRDQPISWELQQVLQGAAEAAGISTVLITSGGQPGSGGRRTGSTRHDHGRSADLKLLVGGKALMFSDEQAPAAMVQFVTAAAARGAIGIGAGVDYMGPETLHVGFGSTTQDRRQLVWGSGGRSANAPAWLRTAARNGWENAR